jgi:hypothetical protein
MGTIPIDNPLPEHDYPDGRYENGGKHQITWFSIHLKRVKN